MAKLIPLNKLDKEQRQELAAKAEIIEFKKGQIISFGIPKQRLVYLLSGRLEKLRRLKLFHTIFFSREAS